MKWSTRFERWLMAMCGVGVAAFFTADGQAPVAGFAIVLMVCGRLLTRDAAAGGKGHPLPRWLLNLLVLAALAWAALSALNDPERFVSAIGALLCWLQVIRFFGLLSLAEERQMLVMSVFTAVAAALTSNSLPVGLLLAAYVPVSVWTIGLYQIHAGQKRAGADGKAGRRARASLRRCAWASTGGALAIAAAVFLIVPRNLGADMLGEWPTPAAGATTGFSDKVQLGRSGELSDSQEAALDLLLLDASGRNVGSPTRPVLLRGLTFDWYDETTKAWVRSVSAAEQRTTYPVAPPFSTEVGRRQGPDHLRQRITIRNKQTPYLFAVARPVSISVDRETTVVVGNADSSLAAPTRSGRITYEVESQPEYFASPEQSRQRMPAQFREGRIRERTEELLRSAGYRRDAEAWFTEDDAAIARLIEQRLRSEYRYVTAMTPPRENEDPIEMFLFRTRAGHCEYFASAMAAMLRSVGMDARVVGGYLATEFNEIAGQYTVRQSSAHSWVEAQVAPGQWMTFDPSPPDGVAAVNPPRRGVIGAVRNAYDAAEQAWIAWVVSFDHQARTSVFGVPRGNIHRLTGGLDRLSGLSGRQMGLRMARAALVGVATAAAAALALHGVVGLWRLGSRWAGRVGRGGRGDESEARRAMERRLAFYGRMLQRLERLGVGKPAWRPPMAHAAALAGATPEVAATVRRVAGAYYEARFGGRSLTAEELADVERAVVRLGASEKPR